MSIYVLFGRPGHGKGVVAMHFQSQSWRRGRWIATNMDLEPKAPWYASAIQFGTPDFPVIDKSTGRPFWTFLQPGTDIYIDEAELFFDSNDFRKLAPLCAELIANQRKVDFNIFFICKRVENLYNRFREAGDAYYECRWTYKTNPLWGVAERLLRVDLKPFTRFVVKEFGDSKCKDELRRQSLSYRTCARRYFGLYKTQQLFSVGG